MSMFSGREDTMTESKGGERDSTLNTNTQTHLQMSGMNSNSHTPNASGGQLTLKVTHLAIENVSQSGQGGDQTPVDHQTE